LEQTQRNKRQKILAMHHIVLLTVLLGAATALPQGAVLEHQFQAPPPNQVTFGVDAAGCLVGPSGKVCPGGSVQFISEAKGVNPPLPPATFRQQAPTHHHQNQFVGLVGPSGVIGPSGLVGPSGPVHFGAHHG